MLTTADREHRFFLSMSSVLAGIVLWGFGPSFFLRAWQAQPPGASEPFYLWHGLAYSAWFALLLAQCVLAGSTRMPLHRQLGLVGALLLPLMLALGWQATRIAVLRPGGFNGIPLPPLVFAVVPLLGLLLFAGMVLWGMSLRSRDRAGHKRAMLIASVGISEAAIARLPLDMGPQFPLGLGWGELITAALLLPLWAFDIHGRGRPHRVTVIASLLLLALLLGRMPLAFSPLWAPVAQDFARARLRSPPPDTLAECLETQRVGGLDALLLGN